eukprot:2997863-Prymnesium_polylepis.1
MDGMPVLVVELRSLIEARRHKWTAEWHADLMMSIEHALPPISLPLPPKRLDMSVPVASTVSINLSGAEIAIPVKCDMRECLALHLGVGDVAINESVLISADFKRARQFQ